MCRMREKTNPAEPLADCSRCIRLADFRAANTLAEPGWHNAPVPSFGAATAKLLIVGLAPGLKGANRTGRPFTGDYAGDLLYATLVKYEFARGTYGATAADGLALQSCRITNSVRCVPPQNKPVPAEIKSCGSFLQATINEMTQLAAIVALGRIAHDAVLTSLGKRKSAFMFKHGARHPLTHDLSLFDSYHCSRYNTNTGVLTEAMFHQVFADVRVQLSNT